MMRVVSAIEEFVPPLFVFQDSIPYPTVIRDDKPVTEVP